MRDILIDEGKCILCNACLETCPAHIFFAEDSRVQVHHGEHCIGCGHCVSVCPADAIIHEGLDLAGFLPVREASGVSPESIYNFLRSRRSCRAYEPKEVSKQILEKLTEIGRFAPSAHNWQDFEFIVIQDKARIGKLSKIAATFYGNMVKTLEASKAPIPFYLKQMMYGFRLNHQFSLQGKDRIFRGAPVVILLHASAENASSQDNCHYALFHMVIMAHALGLGTCINRYFVAAAENVPEIPKELNMPEGHKIYGCVTLGFPKHKFHKLPPREPPKVKWI